MAISILKNSIIRYFKASTSLYQPKYQQRIILFTVILWHGSLVRWMLQKCSFKSVTRERKHEIYFNVCYHIYGFSGCSLKGLAADLITFCRGHESGALCEAVSTHIRQRRTGKFIQKSLNTHAGIFFQDI